MEIDEYNLLNLPDGEKPIGWYKVSQSQDVTIQVMIWRYHAHGMVYHAEIHEQVLGRRPESKWYHLDDTKANHISSLLRKLSPSQGARYHLTSKLELYQMLEQSEDIL